MPFKVECGTETYRIIGPNGEEGERVCWDTVASIKIGEELYICEGDPDADEQSVERVVHYSPEASETEFVEFEDEENEEEDDGVIPISPIDDEEEDNDDDPDGGEEAVA